MDATALKTLPEIIDDNQAPITRKLSDEGKEFVILPQRMKIESLKKIRDEDKLVPDYRADNLTTHDLSSFIDHVKRYVSKDTVILSAQPVIDGNEATYSMNAMIDYHPEGDDVTKAGAKKHVIRYLAEMHARATRWLRHERNWLSQADFAAFVEDNLSDLVVLEGFTPQFGSAVATPADMLTLSRGLEVRVNQTVRNHSRLASGEVALVFSTENTKQDGSELNVAEWFGIRIPLFIGTVPVVLPVRLRYKVREGEIKFQFLFHDFDRVLEATVLDAVSRVRKELPDTHLVEGVV